MKKKNRSRIYTNFLLTDIATGRIQTVEPNLQNMPKGDIKCREPKTQVEYFINVRSSFVARKSFLLMSADYETIELRLLTHVSDEPNLKQFFNQSEQGDFFKVLASNWKRKPVESISKEEREQVKGICYAWYVLDLEILFLTFILFQPLWKWG